MSDEAEPGPVACAGQRVLFKNDPTHTVWAAGGGAERERDGRGSGVNVVCAGRLERTLDTCMRAASVSRPPRTSVGAPGGPKNTRMVFGA